jgi:hypothetical protein
MALMIKLPMHLWNFYSQALNKATQTVLGKFPTEAKISMTISNSEWHDIRFEHNPTANSPTYLA